VIKVVLSLHHEEIPPQSAFARKNPHIAWEETAVRVRSSPSRGREVDGGRIGRSEFVRLQRDQCACSD